MTTTLIPPPMGLPAPEMSTVDFETTKEVGYYGLIWRRFRQRKIALAAAIVLLVVVVICFIGPVVLSWFGVADCADLSQANLGPFQAGTSLSAQCGLGRHFHLFGTDSDGRDLLVRNLTGGQISLLVGLATMVVAIVIGTTMGALAGFLGGAVDTVVTGVTNLVLSIPSILILIIFTKAVNPSGSAELSLLVTSLSPATTQVVIIVLGISIISWPQTARVVRSVVLSVREKEFVEAARALGTSRRRIILRHLLPNALGPIVVAASLTIGSAILTESAISFLGYGINPPTATWGNLLQQGEGELSSGTVAGFFYDVYPGLLILLTVLSFNYIGDALRDAFDPRSIER